MWLWVYKGIVYPKLKRSEMKKRIAKSILIKQMKFDRCFNRMQEAMEEIYGTYNDDDHRRVCLTDEAFELLGVPDEGTVFRENGETFVYTQDGLCEEYYSLMAVYDMSIERAVELFMDKVEADIRELYEDCEVCKDEL